MKSWMTPFGMVALCFWVWSASIGPAGSKARPDSGIRQVPHASQPATYYVDSEAGNDAVAGTSPDQAWRSLEPVNRAVFGAGDRILFKAGSRFSGQLRPHGSGKDGKPIVIDTYGTGERPLIAAEGKHGEALLLANQEYWEVNGLALTNNGSRPATFRYGVRIRAWDFGTMHHIYLKNLFVHDVNGSLIKQDRGEGHGIVWETGGKSRGSRLDGLLIEGCRLLRTDRNGICGYSENSDRTNWYPSLHVLIRNNVLEDIGGDGIKVWGCESCLVEHNRLTRGGQRAPDYSAGIWPWSSDHTVIQFNEVSEFKGTRDGQAFDSDGNCNGTVFQYNYSHDNDGGFMLICSSGTWTPPRMIPNSRTVIRYNISQNDHARTFHISGPVRDVQIYNNVFFIGRTLDIPVFLFTDWDGWSQGIQVANNIFFAEGKARYASGIKGNRDGTYQDTPGFGRSTNNLFEHNLYFGNHVNPPRDASDITGDPQLMNPGTGQNGLGSLEGYRIKPGSPCLGAGKIMSANGGRDFFGIEVPAGKPPSIGVCER